MTAPRRWYIVPVFLACLLVLAPQALPPHPVAAATLTFRVNSTADAPDATPGDGLCADTAGQCTLRAAIQEADAQPGGRAITIRVPGGHYVLTLGVLNLTANTIAIVGVGARRTVISGNRASQVFSIGTTASIARVTITGGHTIGGGGGIVNGGQLQLTGSAVISNTAATGGGIYNVYGSLRVSNSTISGNAANSTGGGIDNYGGTLSVSDSTLSGNSASYGGGIYNAGAFGATVTLSYATIVGNTSGLDNYTIRSPAPTLALNGTIVAKSTAGPNCLGPMTENQGYNLDDGTTCGLSQTTDLTDTDPLLGPLANNGGPTQTMALLPGSPAIDHGGTSANGCPASDQRGVPRPQGPACDIGAYEYTQCATLSSDPGDDRA